MGEFQRVERLWCRGAAGAEWGRLCGAVLCAISVCYSAICGCLELQIELKVYLGDSLFHSVILFSNSLLEFINLLQLSMLTFNDM